MKYVIPPLSLEQINTLRYLVSDIVCQDGSQVVKNMKDRNELVKAMADDSSKPYKKTFEIMNKEELQIVKDWAALLQLLNDATGKE